MNHFSFTPSGVCSRRIDFDLDEGGRVHNVTFTGGCAGNTQGVSSLAEGMTAHELIQRLGGIDCRGKGTSCPDQLAKALGQALK